MEPDVAVDPEGNAFAVWMYNGQNSEVRGSRYDTTTNVWDSAYVSISTENQNAYEAQVACDLDGNAIAIWRENGNPPVINARYYDAGTGSWSGIVKVGEFGEWGKYPDVTFDAYGNAMAVWFQEENIYVSRLEAGDWPNWTPENGSPLEAEDDASSSVPPQIVLDAEGNGAVGYVDMNEMKVKVKRYRAGVDWSAWIGDETEATFTTFDSMNQGVQSLDGAVGPNGRMIAVWDDNGEIKAAVFK